MTTGSSSVSSEISRPKQQEIRYGLCKFFFIVRIYRKFEEPKIIFSKANEKKLFLFSKSEITEIKISLHCCYQMNDKQTE